MQLIGTRRAASIFGISREVFGRWVLAGEIPFVHKMDGETGAYLFDAAVIEDLARQRAEAEAEEAPAS